MTLVAYLPFLAAELVIVVALWAQCRQLRGERDEARAMRDYWHAMMADRATRLDRIEPMYTAALAWRVALSGPDGVANAERALLAAVANYEETPHE